MNILPLGRIEYSAALEIQNSLVDELIAGTGEETLLLLEHDPVYTIGRTRDQSSLREICQLSHPVIETNRGGQATYHGPGQLVGYPILDLNRRGRDLHLYLRFLESFLIELCKAHGIESSRREGLTGVWIGPRKIASLGVGVRKWISMHGFALNVLESSMQPFRSITPCGIAGVQMTSLERETGRRLDFQTVSDQAGELFMSMCGAPFSSCCQLQMAVLPQWKKRGHVL